MGEVYVNGKKLELKRTYTFGISSKELMRDYNREQRSPSLFG